MEGIISASDEQSMVSTFLEIAVGQTAETATQFLQATSWKLDEAIQLFFLGTPDVVKETRHDDDATLNGASSLGHRLDSASDEQSMVSTFLDIAVGQTAETATQFLQATSWKLDEAFQLFFLGIEGNSAPLLPSPDDVVRETRQDDDATLNGASSLGHRLDSLFRPPFHLMFQGRFENAKAAASVENKWLLVNLQSAKEFTSHMLNRDTWGNQAFSQTIGTTFVFWQANDDSFEGTKVCSFYRLDSVPVVLLIDPITGQKMRLWCGMVQPEELLEDLEKFMDGSPRDYHATLSHKRPRIIEVSADETNEDDEERLRAVAASMNDVIKISTETTKKLTYPPLPEEPKGERNLLCRVGVRLPDGRRVQRNFLRTDPIQLLWSFCYSQLGEAEPKPFRLTLPIPGASKSLNYDDKLTFEESGLANSMIAVAWE